MSATMDESWRVVERAWRESPDDPAAIEAAARAMRRARVPLPFELIVRLPRWEKLVGFVKKWYARPIDVESGHSEDTIGEAEDLLGVDLPESLKEWFRLLGHRREITSFQNRAVPVSELEIDDDVLIVYRENQDVEVWGIRRRDLEQDDPPVVVTDQYVGGDAVWQPSCERLSDFFLFMLQIEATSGARSRYLGATTGLSCLERIVATYPAAPHPRWDFKGAEVRIVEDEDTLIVICHGWGIGIARTERAWLRLCAVAGEGWEPAT
jgi:hypothetical protein